MHSHLSRWNLLPTVLALTIVATGCGDLVEPPDTDAGSPVVQFTAFDPSMADSAALERAERWAQAGDSALLLYLRAERDTSVDLTGPSPKLSYVAAPAARWGDNFGPNRSLASSSPETALPLDPENWKKALIYSHSVVPFLSGSDGMVRGKLTFSGNWAETKITFKAYTNTVDLVPRQTITKQGKSGFAPCVGEGCWHVFDLSTSVAVDVGRSCGAYLQASGTHEAAWSAIQIPRIAFLGAWGQVYASSYLKVAYNGDCRPCGQWDASLVGNDGPRPLLSCAGDGGDGNYQDEDDAGGPAVYALQICESTDYYHPVTMHFMYTVPGPCRVEYHMM